MAKLELAHINHATIPVRTPPPMFVTVKLRVALAPTSTVPKLRLVVLTAQTGPWPVPVTGTSGQPLFPVTPRVTGHEVSDVLCGVKRTVTGSDCSAPSENAPLPETTVTS